MISPKQIIHSPTGLCAKQHAYCCTHHHLKQECANAVNTCLMRIYIAQIMREKNGTTCIFLHTSSQKAGMYYDFTKADNT